MCGHASETTVLEGYSEVPGVGIYLVHGLRFTEVLF